MDFCKRTEELWKIYFSAEEEDVQKALECIDENCVIIGTGTHEYYLGLEEFLPEMGRELKERSDISFHFKNFWCQQVEIVPDACLVYGGIHIWWESSDREICIDMDSRFSVVYRRMGEQWKIVHIHQSMPNREQMRGEYYPKTLVEQVIEVKKIADKMARLAQKDSLTELINFRTFEKIWGSWREKDSWLYVIDFDDFKLFNDTYGHVAGNQALRNVAGILEASVRSRDVVCRMGGDEFLLLCGNLQSLEMAKSLAQRILHNVAMRGREEEEPWPAISIGGTAVREEDSLEEAMERADKALYEVKRSTKNGWKLDGNEAVEAK